MAKIIHTEKQKSKASIRTPDTSALLSALFDKKDPTWVHLNRVIKKKRSQTEEFPFQDAQLSEFYVPGKSKALFSEEEKSVIQLEAELKTRDNKLSALNKKLADVEKASYQKGLKEGYEKGMSEGYSQAKKEMNERVKSLQEQVLVVVEKMEDQRADILKQAEKLIIDLVMSLVRKIIHIESETNPEVIRGVTENALHYLAESSRLTIKLHPDDAEKVNNELSLWVPVNKTLKQAVIEEDARIQRGGCVITTDAGDVDSRLDTQIKKMEELVEQVWEEGSCE